MAVQNLYIIHNSEKLEFSCGKTSYSCKRAGVMKWTISYVSRHDGVLEFEVYGSELANWLRKKNIQLPPID